MIRKNWTVTLVKNWTVTLVVQKSLKYHCKSAMMAHTKNKFLVDVWFSQVHVWSHKLYMYIQCTKQEIACTCTHYVTKWTVISICPQSVYNNSLPPNMNEVRLACVCYMHMYVLVWGRILSEAPTCNFQELSLNFLGALWLLFIAFAGVLWTP